MQVGERIAEARAEHGLTQAQLASAVGVDRSALAKIESGIRRVSALELVAIARELHRRVEWFVDPGPESIVSYRTTRSGIATQTIDTELDRIVRDVEFVADQIPGLVAGQPEPMAPPRTTDDTEALAIRARDLLGLAQEQPAHDLASLVTEIALLPFVVRLGDGADAGTVLLRTGGVTVVNGDLHVGRRRLALAHELGHYLIADPYTTDWRIDSTEAEPLEARLDRFARALLMPATDLETRWHAWMNRPGEALRDVAVRAGSHYRVDMATLARRLTECGLIGTDDAAAVRQVQTKKADIVEKNLVVHHEMEPVCLPRRHARAVLSLYRNEVISDDRALGLLYGTFDQDALPDLPPRSPAEIWTVTS